MKYTIDETAIRLLGRKLKESDGIALERVEKIENKLGQQLPQPLKDFYTKVGNVDLFTSSFNIFKPIDKLEVNNNMLSFLDENQGACYWAINIQDMVREQVYMLTETETGEIESHKEVELNDFINIIMYLQCAEGGFKYGCAVYDYDFDNRDGFKTFVTEITSNLEKVVDNEGFIAYHYDNKLIWYYSDREGNVCDILFASAQTEEDLKELEKLGFNEL